jgi:hypothetical protein
VQTFWDWFIGEAGAAWIALLFTTGWALYERLRRERPPKVVIQEAFKAKTLELAHRSNVITTLFTDAEGEQHPIDKLVEVVFFIYNDGSRDILDSIELVLNLGEEGDKGLWRLFLEDIKCTSEKAFDHEGFCTGVRIKIPYLNSFPNHKHYTKALLISDRELTPKLSQGIGKGWSARLVPLQKIERMERLLERILNNSLLVIALAGLAGTFYASERLGIVSLAQGKPVIELWWGVVLAIGIWVALILGLAGLAFLLKVPILRQLSGGRDLLEFCESGSLIFGGTMPEMSFWMQVESVESGQVDH